MVSFFSKKMIKRWGIERNAIGNNVRIDLTLHSIYNKQGGTTI